MEDQRPQLADTSPNLVDTKIPGITALARVSKTAFPDFNAWDPLHPYFDIKSDPLAPTWYMTELEFDSHLPNLVSLKLLQHLATLSEVPKCVEYLTTAHLAGIKEMQLLSRARLSVQPVDEAVYEAIVLLGTHGGWDEMIAGLKKGPVKKRIKKDESEEEAVDVPEDIGPKPVKKQAKIKKENKEKDMDKLTKPPAQRKAKPAKMEDEASDEGQSEEETYVPRSSRSRATR